MLKSKSIELSDYNELDKGLAAAYYSNGVCLGKGLPVYIPHAHRMWEYASALQTLFEHPMPRSVLDIGCGHSILGPAAYLAKKVRLTELEPLAQYADRGQVLSPLCDGKYEFIRGALPDGPDKQFDAVFCISVMEHIQEKVQRMSWKRVASFVGDGGVLAVTVDCGVDGVGDAREREKMFGMDDVKQAVAWLEESGITVNDCDYTAYPPQVNDYTFFRILGRRK